MEKIHQPYFSVYKKDFIPYIKSIQIIQEEMKTMTTIQKCYKSKIKIERVHSRVKHK